jgi:polysaccharide pyruvyl transferase WcaK-like protein
MAKKKLDNRRNRICLLTPYTGGNLGDGAIQDAVIGNLRKRLPDAEILLLTLNPSKTTALHGVASLPLAGFAVFYYSNYFFDGNAAGDSAGTNGAASRAIRRFKNRPELARLLRPLWRRVKRLLRSMLAPVRELFHSARMYGLLRECRVLIVSGGGQIDDYWGGAMGHPYALFKWALLAKAARAKFAFLSVGVCTLEQWPSNFFIRNALRWADYRSYRDSGSKLLLDGLKFTRSDKVVPDLAFSYPASGLSVREKPAGRIGNLRIGISPIAYLLHKVWPREDKASFDEYSRNLAAFTSRLLNQGHEVILFATDEPDQTAIDLLFVELAKCGGSNDCSRLRRVQVSCVEELMKELRELDFVVASRLHGVILSHLCEKPTLAISYDRKVTQHMLDMGQQDYCLNFADVTTSVLASTFDSLCSRGETLKASIRSKCDGNRRQLMSQYAALLLHTDRNRNLA